MAKQFTPNEVMKVANEILKTQRERGYKAGWVRHEMERRADKVEARLWAYSISGKSPGSELGWQLYYVAAGEQSKADMLKTLEFNYEAYNRAEEEYGIG